MKTTCEQWMKEVDSLISRQIGLGANDLPDFLYRDAYDDGRTTKSVAREVIKVNMDEMGF